MNYDNNILGPSSSPETDQITKALAAAHAESQHVALDAANPHFKSRFSSYATCCGTLRGPLTKNGIALPDFRPGLVNGQWIVVGTLRHTSGQWISGIAPLINPKGDMQGFGAAMTYAKRTLLMALAGGFSGEADDDGESTVVSRPVDAKASAKADAGAKNLAYQQGALNAIATAETIEQAQKHLDMVRLRAKEKAIPVEVFRRVEAEFNKKWNTNTEVEA